MSIVVTPFVPPNTAPWATYVKFRRPQFKAHSTHGLAKQAVAYHGKNTRIFEWVDGEGWVER